MTLELGMFLLVLRCLMLLMIAVALGIYHDPTARRRPVVSMMATCTMGAALSWATFSMLTALQCADQVSAMGELWPTLFVACALIPILYARGNVAKLLPRAKWLHQ
jgi:hypothetical protein